MNGTKAGEKKPCINPNCDSDMVATLRRAGDVAFHDPAGGSAHPEPIPDYLEWVCPHCERTQPISN